MEFESKKDKVVFFIFGIVTILSFIGVFCLILKSDRDQNARHEGYQQDCKTLDAKWGDLLKTKEGPYSEVMFVAVKFGDESVGVRIYNTKEEIMYFRCADLVRKKK